MEAKGSIYIIRIEEDAKDQESTVLNTLSGHNSRVPRVAWSDLNRTLISASEDGIVRQWDVEVTWHCRPCDVALPYHTHPRLLTS